ncbi:MAG TPA: outer membrane protein assembly factor BamE [Myxococcota bacterium]
MRELRAWGAALVLIASCALAGCLNVGQEFPVAPVKKIQIGKTTQDDVRAMFGEPWRTGIEDGQRTWTYGRYRYSVFAPAATRDLVVRFDTRGLVTSYTFNSTHAEDARL